MALAVCYKMLYIEQPLPMQNLAIRSQKGYVCNQTACPNKKRTRFMSRELDHARSSLFCKSLSRESDLKMEHDIEGNHNAAFSGNVRDREYTSKARYVLECSTNEKQLGSLDSYFDKLKNGSNGGSSNSSVKMADLRERSGQLESKKGLETVEAYLGKVSEQLKSKKGLESVEAYLDKLTKDEKLQNNVPSTSRNLNIGGIPVETPISASENLKRVDDEKVRSYMAFRRKDGERESRDSQVTELSEETSDLYKICIIVSVNIAVYLFEIATPIKSSDSQLFSLPLMYGAKINDLILVGEWWRLITPMFLHSGFLHVALNSWALLTFSPQVSRSYGSFTFILIYILGGFSGNLTSFLHTPEATAGGTGPIFAIIGAWVAHQYRNKDMIAKDVSDSMTDKVLIISTIGFVLSSFGPIDEWALFGAYVVGGVYGFLTCPTLQVDDASSGSGKEEGMTLVKRQADPLKSLGVFVGFLLVLSSLLLFIEPPLTSMGADKLM